MSVEESYQIFINKVEPLFPKETLVQQKPREVFLALNIDLNQEIRQIENNEQYRNQGRRGIYLGMLVKDMRWNDQHAFCDLKPWLLLQPPSAPPHTNRCRTCAERAPKRDPEPGRESDVL